MRGVVEFFDDRRGFGRLTPSDGSAPVFCHFSEINDELERVLIQGEEVEYVPEDGPQGPLARGISRIDQRFAGTVKSFDKGFGWISPSDGETDLLVHFSDIAGSNYKRLEPGENVTFAIGANDKGKKATRVRRLDTRPALEKFALLKAFEFQLKHLAEDLAHKEDWDYKHTQSAKPYPVLRSYIYYTFGRLESEGKIAHAPGTNGKQIACFNTGLASERQEPIFALF